MTAAVLVIQLLIKQNTFSQQRRTKLQKHLHVKKAISGIVFRVKKLFVTKKHLKLNVRVLLLSIETEHKEATTLL